MPKSYHSVEAPPREIIWACRVLIVFIIFLTILIARRGIAEFFFDDAFMFVRYALHVRGGYGISWNQGGPHTAGLTSPLWLIPVILGSFLHLPLVPTAVFLSIASGFMALLVLTRIVQSTAQSAWLSNYEVAFVIITLPLLLSTSFTTCLTNGMETMFGLLMICLLYAAARHFLRHTKRFPAILLGAIGLACLLVRPESGLCVVVLPILMWFWTSERPPARVLVKFLLTFTVFLIGILVVDKLYFGVVLPLPFYIKGMHGYAKGYRYFPNPLENLFEFTKTVWPAIVVLILFTDKKRWRETLVFLFPLGLTFFYLFSVQQIMGQGGRYYMPYLALLYIPAFEALDRWCFHPRLGKPAPLRFACLLLVPALAAEGPISQWAIGTFSHFQIRGRTIYDPPKLIISAALPLRPMFWGEATRSFAEYAVSLPGNPKIALTEAGIVGATIPKDDVLDLVGLNDRHIALNGSSTDYIFEKQPDIIWMPDIPYTWLRGVLYSDPRLLKEYDVYASAFIYGVAIRKSSPYSAIYRRQLETTWKQLYPGSTPDEYRVQSVTWDGNPKRL